MGEEQVGALDDILVVRLALFIEQLSYIRNRDGLGPSTARHEDVRMVAEVRIVPEVGAVRDDLARGEGDVVVLDKNDVAVLAELRPIKVRDHLAGLGQAHEFGAVDAIGIGQDTSAIDNCDVLLITEEDLVRAEVWWEGQPTATFIEGNPVPPSGPPVCTLVISGSFKSSSLYVPTTY